MKSFSLSVTAIYKAKRIAKCLGWRGRWVKFEKTVQELLYLYWFLAQRKVLLFGRKEGKNTFSAGINTEENESQGAICLTSADKLSWSKADEGMQ